MLPSYACQSWGPTGLNPQSQEALRGYGETYHVDKSREEHQGDGEHPNQGAVLLRSHYLSGECLQGSGEELAQEGRKRQSRNQLEPLRQPWSSEDIPCPWNSSPDLLEPLQDCVAPCSFHCPLPQIARASALDRESVNRAHHTDD